MDIIAEQNITKFDIISTQVVNEFVVEVVQDIINFDINFAQLGEQGQQGIQGQQGKSAWQLVQESGFVGTYDEWITSLTDKKTNYTHLQDIPSAIWLINHSLGYNPSVSTTNSANEVVIGNVQYTNNNNLTITFGAPFSGKAYVS